MKSEINKKFGIYSELKTAIKVEKEQGIKLQEDDKLYKKKIHQYKNVCFYLVGKVDRIEVVNGENLLIEIKNRVNRLFNRLYEYENIQIQCYFQLLPKKQNIINAKLIEQYNEQTNTILVTKDEVLWNQVILPLLISFSIELVEKTTSSSNNNINYTNGSYSLKKDND